MLVRMKNEEGELIKIDPGTICQFWHIAKDITGMQHETSGVKEVVYVNHTLEQITACVCFVDVNKS
ncbi:MAG: hypothetical protein WC679_01630 [Bacteroidales bacterium]|jgi:hypothetical protein